LSFAELRRMLENQPKSLPQWEGWKSGEVAYGLVIASWELWADAVTEKFNQLEKQLREELNVIPNKKLSEIIDENVGNYDDVAFASLDLGRRRKIEEILEG